MKIVFMKSQLWNCISELWLTEAIQLTCTTNNFQNIKEKNKFLGNGWNIAEKVTLNQISRLPS